MTLSNKERSSLFRWCAIGQKFLRHCSNFANCAKSRKWGKARQRAWQSWVDESADNDLRRCHSYEQEVPQQCLSMKKILTSHRSKNYGFKNSILFRNIECSRPIWSSAMTFGTNIIYSLPISLSLYILPMLTFLHRCQKVLLFRLFQMPLILNLDTHFQPINVFFGVGWGNSGPFFLVLD